MGIWSKKSVAVLQAEAAGEDGAHQLKRALGALNLYSSEPRVWSESPTWTSRPSIVWPAGRLRAPGMWPATGSMVSFFVLVPLFAYLGAYIPGSISAGVGGRPVRSRPSSVWGSAVRSTCSR